MPWIPRHLRCYLALAGALLVPAIAPAQDATATMVPGLTEALPLEGGEMALLTLPEPGPGRLPVAVLLPDLDGPGPRTAAYGERLQHNGWALVELLRGDAVAAPPGATLNAMLAAAQTDARLDPSRHVVLGLGGGARTALVDWAAGAPASTLVLLYPGCDAALLATVRAARPVQPSSRVLIVTGAADAANEPAACRTLAEAFPPGTLVQQRVLASATYGWDGFELVPPGARMLSPHPANDGRRVIAVPDRSTTLMVADRVLGFAMSMHAAR